MYKIAAVALLLLAHQLNAQCWGQAPINPVRVDPLPTIITPHNTIKDGWTWDANGRYWWRVKQAPVQAPVKAGCTCEDKGVCEDPDSCECRKTGKPCCSKCFCVVASINYGVDVARIRAGQTYSINGRPCTRNQVFGVIEAGLKDDSALEHLAVVGDKALHDKVRSLMDAMPEWQGKVHVQYYTPDQWQVTSRGLRPGITLRDSKGNGLGHLDSADRADLLDRLLRRKPSPAPSPPAQPDSPSSIPPVAWLLAALAAALLFWPKKSEAQPNA